MVFLHPIYNIIFLILFVGSCMETYYLKKKTSFFMWVAGAALVIAAGFRYFVGADYGAYVFLYEGIGHFFTYEDIFNKAVFMRSKLDVEWIYSLINKFFYDKTAPFFMVTFVVALISISLKLTTIYKYVAYPTLGMLFYFMPLHFFEDSGQIRQGIGVAFCIFSFRFIAQRNLPMFLFTIYLAIGMHKTSIVFLPAYWLATIPMNSLRIVYTLSACLALSVLEPYRWFGGLFESLLPQDISSGYSAYLDDSTFGASVAFGMNDVVKFLFVILMVVFDKKACEKVPYYEYMRNLAVTGLCIYYIMRTNKIFAIRLPGAYTFFIFVFVAPSIVYAVGENLKKVLHAGFMTYLVLMYFNFTLQTGRRAGFTSDIYRNVLWKEKDDRDAGDVWFEYEQRNR